MQEQITVNGVVIDVPILYGEGYTLNKDEAAGVEQHRRDKIRNNLAPKIKKWKADGVPLEDIQAEAAEYIDGYTIGVRNGGGVVRDPVVAEALNIAKSKIREELLKNGKKLKDVDGRNIIKAARKLMTSTPEIIKLAQRRVRETQLIAEVDLKSVMAGL